LSRHFIAKLKASGTFQDATDIHSTGVMLATGKDLTETSTTKDSKNIEILKANLQPSELTKGSDDTNPLVQFKVLQLAVPNKVRAV
jgi:hypothetical protein